MNNMNRDNKSHALEFWVRNIAVKQEKAENAFANRLLMHNSETECNFIVGLKETWSKTGRGKGNKDRQRKGQRDSEIVSD